MVPSNSAEAVEKLMRIHYDFFMAHRHFWNENALREADTIVCIAASDIRAAIRNLPAK